MRVLKRILVASDLSPRADYAIARAAQLAVQHGAELVVLHVVEPVMPLQPAEDWLWPAGGLPATVERNLAATAQAELEARMAKLPQATRVQWRVETCGGAAFLEIIRRARALEADLIVVGAHGRAYLRDLLLGTTAERVIRKGDRPVLAVKKPCEQEYRRVLAAVDFSPTSKEAVRLAARLAPRAPIELFHAFELGYEGRIVDGGMSSDELEDLLRKYEQWARDRLGEFARDCGLEAGTTRVIVRHGYPGTTIARAVEEQRADLVCIGTRGLSGMRYVLLGSVAEHVLREVSCDVLVVHPQGASFELP